jgi:hypothetical protein
MSVRRAWKPAAVVALVLLVGVGVWMGLRETGRAACLGSGAPVDSYRGLTLAEAELRAEQDGQVLRVLGRDGECADHTSDRRTDRVNVYLEDGEVVRARRF